MIQNVMKRIGNISLPSALCAAILPIVLIAMLVATFPGCTYDDYDRSIGWSESDSVVIDRTYDDMHNLVQKTVYYKETGYTYVYMFTYSLGLDPRVTGSTLTVIAPDGSLVTDTGALTGLDDRNTEE